MTVNRVMLLINASIGIWQGVTRGFLTARSTPEHAAPPIIALQCIYLGILVSVLELVSGGVLGVALFNIRNEVKSFPELKYNLCTFSMHMSALFLHCFVVTISEYFIYRYFNHPTPENGRL